MNPESRRLKWLAFHRVWRGWPSHMCGCYQWHTTSKEAHWVNLWCLQTVILCRLCAQTLKTKLEPSGSELPWSCNFPHAWGTRANLESSDCQEMKGSMPPHKTTPGSQASSPMCHFPQENYASLWTESRHSRKKGSVESC